MLFSVLTRKDTVPRHNFTLLRPSPGWEEAELSWWLPQSWVPRARPATITEGARSPGPIWPSGSSGHLHSGGRSLRLWPIQAATAVRSQRQGWGRGSPLPQAWARQVGDPGEGSGAPQDPAPWGLFPGPPAHPLAQGQWTGGPPGRKRGSASYLILHMTTTAPPTFGCMGHQRSSIDSCLFVGGANCSTDQWLSRATNGHSLTVGHLGEGPTAALTNGWARPLMVPVCLVTE